MGINIADNFQYLSQKPLDGRTKYDTTAAMKAVPDSSMYDGCMAYCSGTDKTYQWKSSNSVDATLGRWREFSSGGGSGTDANAYHVNDTVTTTLNDNDYFPLLNSTTPKRTLWSTIKAKLKEFFDTLYDLNKTDIPFYAYSSTEASTVAKVATVRRGTFIKDTGAKVSVKFNYTNTTSSATLNVNSTGASYIKVIDSNGNLIDPTQWWQAGDIVTFVYDGSNWIMQPTFATVPNLPVVGTINRSDIYDTTEKVIGCMTDGRPLYQKTFVGTSNSSGNITSVGTLSNARVYNMQGVISNTSTTMANSTTSINIPVGATSTSGSALDVSIFAYFDTSTIYLAVADNANTYRNKGYVITVRYTKTTDSANSYNYVNENDYSTSEKIVGTWVDGSYLYQKNVTVTLPTCSTDGQTATSDVTLSSLGISGVKVVTKCDGYVVNDTIFRRINSTFYTGTVIRELSVVPSKTSLQLRNGTAALSGKTAYVTLQYTK